MPHAATGTALMTDAAIAPAPFADQRVADPTLGELADAALTDAASAAQAALSDVRARPRIGWVVQTVALLLTAAPIIGVAVWSVLWVM